MHIHALSTQTVGARWDGEISILGKIVIIAIVMTITIAIIIVHHPSQ